MKTMEIYQQKMFNFPKQDIIEPKKGRNSFR